MAAERGAARNTLLAYRTDLEEFLRHWTPRDRRDPRAGMGEGTGAATEGGA